MEIRNITPCQNNYQFSGKIDLPVKHIVLSCIEGIDAKERTLSIADKQRVKDYKNMFNTLSKFFNKMHRLTVLKIVPTELNSKEAFEFIIENNCLKVPPIKFITTQDSDLAKLRLNIDFPKFGDREKIAKYELNVEKSAPCYDKDFVIKIKTAIDELTQKHTPKEIDDALFDISKQKGYLAQCKEGKLLAKRRFNAIAEEFERYDDMIKDVQPPRQAKRRMF